MPRSKSRVRTIGRARRFLNFSLARRPERVPPTVRKRANSTNAAVVHGGARGHPGLTCSSCPRVHDTRARGTPWPPPTYRRCRPGRRRRSSGWRRPKSTRSCTYKRRVRTPSPYRDRAGLLRGGDKGRRRGRRRLEPGAKRGDRPFALSGPPPSRICERDPGVYQPANPSPDGTGPMKSLACGRTVDL